MCEFCVKHGEGEKWYLKAKNYSNDLLSDIKRFKFIKKSFYTLDSFYNREFKFLSYLPLSISPVRGFMRKVVKRMFLYEHWGQVVPIEDVIKIFDFANSITRVPCVCRKITTGEERRTCF